MNSLIYAEISLLFFLSKWGKTSLPLNLFHSFHYHSTFAPALDISIEMNFKQEEGGRWMDGLVKQVAMALLDGRTSEKQDHVDHFDLAPL